MILPLLNSRVEITVPGWIPEVGTRQWIGRVVEHHDGRTFSIHTSAARFNPEFVEVTPAPTRRGPTVAERIKGIAEVVSDRVASSEDPDTSIGALVEGYGPRSAASHASTYQRADQVSTERTDQ